MAFMDKLKVLWGKAFVGGEWKVGYRLRNEPHGQYCLVDTPAGTWAADPFLYEANGEHYLFVELYEEKKNKACIAYYRFIDGIPVYQDKIIDQPYHMSYPCVFEHKGEHYMVPETSANGTIDLYKAVEFPNHWELSATLLSGEKYVDSTVWLYNDSLRLISYKKTKNAWQLVFFDLDIDKQKLSVNYSIDYSENSARPAGNMLFDNEFYRPAQDCRRKYGEALLFYRVILAEQGAFKEQLHHELKVTDIKTEAAVARVHTYNRDSVFEVVDIFEERFDIAHGLKIFWRAYMRNWFKGQ